MSRAGGAVCIAVLVLLAGIVLAGCGTVSASTAMTSWVVQSSYLSSAKAVANDARHSANALRLSSTTSVELHTVCGVLLVDTESANASLPTPDDQATNLLAGAYTALGAGANECYGASSSVTSRAKALDSIARGVADLAEASARIANASTP